jgi:hypothetical protein
MEYGKLIRAIVVVHVTLTVEHAKNSYSQYNGNVKPIGEANSKDLLRPVQRRLSLSALPFTFTVRRGIKTAAREQIIPTCLFV